MTIYDAPSRRSIEYTQYGDSDYVFQLNPGINFLTLIGLKTPQESCLWQATRISFEYRSFEDKALTFAIDKRLTGLEPSLSCMSPCGTCKAVDKGFCLSCLDPARMVLLLGEGRCVESQSCPKSYFLERTLTENKECQKCEQGCS